MKTIESSLPNKINCQTTEYVFAYIGIVVPDTKEYHTEAFSRAGNMSQLNLLHTLSNLGINFSLVLSLIPIASFPKNKHFYIHKKQTALFNNCTAILMPFINIQPMKMIHCGINVFINLLVWGYKNRTKKRIIYLYNLSRPPAIFAYIAARLTDSKIVASLFDVSAPNSPEPKDLTHSAAYLMTKWLIPRLDGRIAITKKIIDDFAPSQHYIIMDGALTNECFNILPVKNKTTTTFDITFAGSLWPINGIDIVLEAFSLLDDNTYRLHIVGDGMLKSLVLDAAKKDKRIVYHGYLKHKDVLSLYARSDVLLNIRLVNMYNIPYVFPSKLIEYFATGIPVITTASGHIEQEYGSFCFLLSEENSIALADTIRKVQTTNADIRTQLANEARNYVIHNKTWEHQAKRIVEYLYNKVFVNNVG